MAGKTNIIVAAVYTKLSGQGHRAAEEEKSVEDVERERDGRVGHHAGECAGDEEEEREHGEDGDEHGVVDDRGVAGEGFGDHVADEGQDEEGP